MGKARTDVGTILIDFSSPRCMAMGERIKAEGWDPLEPSDECRAALACPPVLHRMHYSHTRGIVAELATLKLVSRFCRGMFLDEEMHRLMRFTAHIHLMAEVTPRAEWSLEELAVVTKRIETWEEVALRPAQKRMHDDGVRFGHEYIIAHQDQYEPAFTLMYLQAQLDLSDIEGDAYRLGRALLIVDEEAGQAAPRERCEPWMLYDYFNLITADGRIVSRVDAKGRTVLDVNKVVDALQLVHRPRSEPRIAPVSKLALSEKMPETTPESSEPSPVDVANERDVLARVMAAIQAAREAGGSGRAMAAALANAEALFSGETTLVDVAARHQLAPQVVGRALDDVRADVMRRLRA